MFSIVVMLSVFTVCLILIPFFLKTGGQLQAASSVDSLEVLEGVRKNILDRYIEDEQAFKENSISKLAWMQRKNYLCSRYIDTVRRSDFLKSLDQ
tara:strand:- start:287 stop:571 length:285 start_codon:yes stop_codon:yes gene_type:complete